MSYEKSAPRMFGAKMYADCPPISTMDSATPCVASVLSVYASPPRAAPTDMMAGAVRHEEEERADEGHGQVG